VKARYGEKGEAVPPSKITKKEIKRFVMTIGRGLAGGKIGENATLEGWRIPMIIRINCLVLFSCVDIFFSLKGVGWLCLVFVSFFFFFLCVCCFF